MNGYRKMMQDRPDENLSWCVPYKTADGKYALAVCEGKPAGMILDGKVVDYSELEASLPTLAKAVNPDYGDYAGWTDLHLATEAMQECGCAHCPWFGTCDAMDNPDDWSDPDYPDD